MKGSSATVSFGKVAVLMGGESAERAISLKSGAAVLAALQRQAVDAHGVDVGPNVISELVEADFDRALIMLHGRGGEDGVMQGALDCIHLPYTGSGVLGSALGMDKYRSKTLWRGIGLPTPDAVLMTDEVHLRDADAMGYPLMIKPAHEGSSIGMAKVNNRSELEAAWAEACSYDPMVLAEHWITGREYTAAILGHRALPLIRLETPRSFYDYEAKYQADSTQYHCPCGLDEQHETALQNLAMQAFAAVGAGGWGRVDLMLDETDAPWLIEVNTVPGMTDHSLVPMAAKQAGIEFDELVLKILQTSLNGSAS